MARFHFKLEPVLSQRRAEEQRCQRDLAKSLRQRMILRDQLRQMQHAIKKSKGGLSDGLAGAVDVDRVLQFARYSGQVAHRAHAFVARLSGIEKQIDASRRKLVEASRARKAIEMLRERRYQQWKQEMDRRADAQMDELASQWHARRMQSREGVQ